MGQTVRRLRKRSVKEGSHRPSLLALVFICLCGILVTFIGAAKMWQGKWGWLNYRFEQVTAPTVVLMGLVLVAISLYGLWNALRERRRKRRAKLSRGG